MMRWFSTRLLQKLHGAPDIRFQVFQSPPILPNAAAGEPRATPSTAQFPRIFQSIWRNMPDNSWVSSSERRKRRTRRWILSANSGPAALG